MLKIDLHLHSSCSDGVLSPDDLVRELRARRVSIASLTDHDTVEGVRRFLARCRKASIKGVAGVELSAAHDGVLHLLGYRFDAENEALRAALAQNRNARNVRNVLICEKLRGLGFDISLEEVASLAGANVVGRPHIARALWNKGYVPNLKAAFDRYLRRGAEAYVPRPLLPAEECIRLIREAGGLAVLAHPRQTTPDLDDLPPILSRLKNNGLWGLECWSPGNSAVEIYRCLEIAASFSLAPTAGSDFHGNGHSSASAGVVVREDLLPWSHLCGGL